jgi:Ni,Fe-hydrogenase maturation factor
MLPQPRPQVSLEPVVQGPTEEVQEALQVGVQEIVKLVAERFERQPEYA